MNIIVPLAGPDFELQSGQVKAETLVDGLPLLRRALESRSWWRQGLVETRDLVFVLKDSGISRQFATATLQAWYPEARQVFLGDYAKGAALSALVGLSLVAHERAPICIDLADILYDVKDPPLARLKDLSIGGLGLVFESNRDCYSYFRTNDAGRVMEVAEKRVISNLASAGTYFFASPEAYLRGLANNLEAPDRVTYRDLFYVCPVMQGLLDAGMDVAIHHVDSVIDLKMS